MNADKNTPAGSTVALSRGSLVNAALLSAVLLSAVLLSTALLSGLFLGGCESALSEGAGEAMDGKGTVTLTFGKSAGRAITSGIDLPDDVLASMRFEARLTGPNREDLTLNAKWGETAQLRLRQGQWRIDAKAYQADSPNLAGTGSISFDIQPRNNMVIVPMAMRDTAGAPLSCYEISVPGFANGQIEAGFTAAYPGTTVTLTAVPAGGYLLHSLSYTDGTTTYTPTGGGNEYVFTMPDADITVSAAFHPFHTVTYIAGTGGGTVPPPAPIEVGSSVTLPMVGASGGIPFHSWEMGGTVYAEGASYTVTSDVTFTARWAFKDVSGIQAYLTGMSGGSETNPILLPVGIASVNTVWDALLNAIAAAIPDKYVALDLSASTLSGGGTVFDPYSSSLGNPRIVSMVLPDIALSIPNGASMNPRMFDGFTNLKRVDGAGITRVGQYAFSYCISLEEVNFPAAASIGPGAFGNTGGTTALTITLGSTPPTLDMGIDMFINVTDPKSVTVKVPSAALSSYNTTWQNNFKNGSSIILIIQSF
ncbi:MAG: hypothetical protein LBK62_04025 [Treponema sp.]|jgi:hypothetical protein|nr:hypothetical protein [Treponema sp.]